MSALENRRPALGRGLSSLIPSSPKVPIESAAGDSNEGFSLLPIEGLMPADGQPRTIFEQEKLEELAQSIQEHGILQPLVVRKKGSQRFEIVAGERRWRAAQIAGLMSVPCVVSDFADEKILTLALVENLQREDLNPIEEAEAYRQLANEMGLTQDEVATAVGKKRSTIANSLRLLKLPKSVRQMVLEKTLTMGHARALLSLEDESSIERRARQIVAKGLSVRETEALINKLKKNAQGEVSKKSRSRNEDPLFRAVRQRLESTFATRVELKDKNGSGNIIIHYSSKEQLNDIIEKMDSAY